MMRPVRTGVLNERDRLGRGLGEKGRAQRPTASCWTRRAAGSNFEMVRDAVTLRTGWRNLVVTWHVVGRKPYLARVVPQPHVPVTLEQDGT